MGKKMYRVKKGDDFIKISRKLYGDPSYVMDLLRANPGFNWLGPGMVLRLPKEDPRVTRKRKIKRRMKNYVPSKEEETTNDWTESRTEKGNLRSPRIPSDWYNQSLTSDTGQTSTGASLGVLDDPAFLDEVVNTIAETAAQMGLNEEAMLDELGMGEGSPLLREETSTGWTESRTEKGNLRSTRRTPDRETRSQTTLTDEQIDTLKDELEKLGLDVDVAMNELGLSENDPYASEPPKAPPEPSGDTGDDRKDDDKDSPGGKVARPALPEEPTPTPDDMIPTYQEIKTDEDLNDWFNAAYDIAVEKGDTKEKRMLENLRYYKKMELWMKEQGTWQAMEDMLAEKWKEPALGTTMKEPLIIEYVIQPGDNLERIALENGCTLPEIMEINNIDNPNMIIAGDTLTFPQRLGEYAIMPERASQEGMGFIKDHEDLQLTLYDDLGPGNGNCTIGYGHKVHDDPCDGRAEETEFLSGISEQRALEFLEEDMSDAADSVRLYVQAPLNNSQFDALVSFVFNTGRGTLKYSRMLELLNQQQYEKVPGEMMQHIYAKVEGQLEEIEGLKNHRQDEADLFTNGVYNE